MDIAPTTPVTEGGPPLGARGTAQQVSRGAGELGMIVLSKSSERERATKKRPEAERPPPAG